MNDYDKQAETFLRDTDTEFTVVKANQTCPDWSEKCKQYAYKLDPYKRATIANTRVLSHNHGIKYNITFSRSGKVLSFPFWSSIADSYRFDLNTGRELKPIPPSAYSVLSAISGDIGAHDQTFEEFCDNLGYSSDSIKAKQAYDDICDISRQMSRLWSEEELGRLSEIS